MHPRLDLIFPMNSPAETSLMRLCDLAFHPMLLFDAGGTVLYGNETACVWLGYAREALPYLKADVLGIPFPFVETADAARATLRHSSGGELPSLVRLSPWGDSWLVSCMSEEGHPDGVAREAAALRARAAAALLDLRRKEAEVYELTQFFVAMLENTDDFMFFKDANHVYKAASATMAKITGHASWRELNGKTDYDIFPKEHADNYMRLERELKEGQLDVIRETQPFRDVNGEEGWVDNRKYPVRDADGKFIGLFGVCRIITDRVRLERQLTEEKVRAEAANRAKSVFLANMSHELRTPLNAILGYTQMMLGERSESDPEAATLRIINRSGEHLLGLINSVLDLSKIESHKYALDPEDFDLGQFLRELTDILRRRAEDKGLTLEVDQTSSFPRYVRADRNKLRQVLLNIVGNAIKFTEKGGVTLKLATGGVLRPDGAAELVFSVRDTGSGIDSEDLERIFKPFEQASRRPRVEGTGLGLAIAREFVRLMGGDVLVTSELGRGSVFTFNLFYAPVGEAGAAALESAGTEEVLSLEGTSGLRVLIVEDQPENRMLLRRLLARYGFEIAEAENGAVGVGLAESWKPHLILMDRRMPVLDGVEAARRVRALPEGSKIRIVAVTAEAFREDYERMMSAGCDAFVRKPYKISELLKTIASLLPVTLSHRQSAQGHPVGAPAASGAAFAALPSGVLAALRKACDSADPERAAEILAPYPEAAAEAEPFLHDYRLDLLAALLPR